MPTAPASKSGKASKARQQYTNKVKAGSKVFGYGK